MENNSLNHRDFTHALHRIHQTKANINSPRFEGVPTAPTAKSSNISNQLATTEFVANSAAEPYEVLQNLKKIEDYLYAVQYENLDYDYAKDFFLNNSNINLNFGCTSIRNDNLYGRNYDWIYDDSVDFIVQTNKTINRHGVLGIAGHIPELDKSTVELHKYNPLYHILPFMLLDGMNDAGIVCSLNVVPQEKGVTTSTTPLIEERDKINMLMLPRYILDNFNTAEEATTYIKNYISVYMPKHLQAIGYELHMMIADSEDTLVLECIDNEIIVIDSSSHPDLENFFIHGITYNSNGSFYTPATQDASHNAIITNGITEHGSGLERHNYINTNYSSTSTKAGMRTILNALNYTNSYKESTNPFWYTEFVGDCTVASNVEDFTEIVAQKIEDYEQRERSDGKTWQTVHSSIYNLDTFTLYVQSQEQNTEHSFQLLTPIETMLLNQIEQLKEKIDSN